MSVCGTLDPHPHSPRTVRPPPAPGLSPHHMHAGPQVSLAVEYCQGPSLLVALPLFNSIGMLGGFVGPYLVGSLVARLKSFAVPMLLMGLSLATSGGLVLMLRLGCSSHTHARPPSATRSRSKVEH